MTNSKKIIIYLPMSQLWRVLFTKTSGFFTTGNQVHVLAILCFSHTHTIHTLRPTY